MGQPEMEPMGVSEAADQIESLIGDMDLGEEFEEAPEESEQDQDETADNQEDEPEAEESEDGEEEGSEDAEPDDSEETQGFETIDELAEALEVPIEELLDTLQGKVKIDGQEQLVTLKEAMLGYQKDADYRQKTAELAENRKAFETQQQQLVQHTESQLMQLGQFVQQAEQLLAGEMNSEQMEQLRTANPAEWTARRAEYAERLNGIQQIKQQAANQYSQAQQQQQAQTAEQMQSMLQKEQAALSDKLPNLDRASLNTYLKGDLGYTDSELSQVYDHRLVVMAEKARLYDQQAKQGKVAKKKIKQLPKLQKPARQVKAKATGMDKAKSRFRKTNDVKDAAAVIENLL